jgi:hypothetical protein
MDLLFNQAPSAENLMQTAVIIEPEPMVLTAESMESPEASVNMEES